MRTELYRIAGAGPGQLAIMPRPRGGDWLEDEIRSWSQTGVDAVVSLLTPDEIADLDLAEEERLCRANGIDFVSFPFPDRSLPSSREAFAELIAELGHRLATGATVAVHCRQGIGRAALVAICLLVAAGAKVEDAIRRVGAARGITVPETAEQRRYAIEFAERPLTAL